MYVSNAAGEFDAYYSQLFGFKDLKQINDLGIEIGIAKKMYVYWDQMTNLEKNQSTGKKAKLDFNY